MGSNQDQDQLKKFARGLDLPSEAAIPEIEISAKVRNASESLILAVIWSWPVAQIKKLMDEGARADLPNKRGVTAMDLAKGKMKNAENKAIRSKYEAIVKLLTESTPAVTPSKNSKPNKLRR